MNEPHQRSKLKLIMPMAGVKLLQKEPHQRNKLKQIMPVPEKHLKPCDLLLLNFIKL